MERDVIHAYRCIEDSFEQLRCNPNGESADTLFQLSCALRALAGLCGRCRYVTFQENSGQAPSLTCQKGHDPKKLYDDLFDEEDVVCGDYVSY